MQKETSTPKEKISKNPKKLIQDLKPKGDTTGIVLKPNGTAETFPLQDRLNRSPTGAYVAEHHALFWLDQPLPRGYISVYVEDNPEPISEREPKGYNAKFLDIVTGSWPVHVVGGGFEGTHKTMKLGKIIIFGIVVLGLIVSGYMWYQERFGG
jgi:hypothetical protein